MNEFRFTVVPVFIKKKEAANIFKPREIIIIDFLVDLVLVFAANRIFSKI